MSSNESFGLWSQQELEESLQRGLSEPLLDSSAPPSDSFYANAVNALRKNSKFLDGTLTSSIFFLSPEVPDAIVASKTLCSERRLNSGTCQLGGRVWFVNARVQRGKYFEFSDLDINGTIDFLMSNGLQDTPAILYTPDEEEAVTFYALGLDQDSTVSISLAPTAISKSKIKESIDTLYEGTLKTPQQAQSANARIWTDPGKWLPADNVEKEIQGRLQSHFYSMFSCNLLVLSEVSTGEGRLDMLLASPGPAKGQMIHHALLELKALRTFSQTGTTQYKIADHKAWIQKGTIQAIAYQGVHNPLHTALCCFDMCKEELTDEYWFSDSAALAANSEVLQWRWRLYNSSDSYRVKKYG